MRPSRPACTPPATTMCRAFEHFGVWSSGAATVTGAGEPEQVATVTVTQGVLPALGVHASLGRWFSPEDDSPGGARTAILSHGYWQRRFGGDREILGRTVVIDFVPHEDRRRDAAQISASWTTSPDLFLAQRFATNRADEFSYNGIGRLKPGLSVAQANEDIARVWRNWARNEGGGKMLEELAVTPNARPLKNDVVGNVGTALRVLMGALGLLMLLVCANVANLVLVRAQARRQEFAIRAALGAGWGRIASGATRREPHAGTHGRHARARPRLPRSPSPRRHRPGRLAQAARDHARADGGRVRAAVRARDESAVRDGGRCRASRATPHRERPRERLRHGNNSAGNASWSLARSPWPWCCWWRRDSWSGRCSPFRASSLASPGRTRSRWSAFRFPRFWLEDPERVIRMQKDILDRLAAIPGVAAVGFASALPLENNRNGVVVAVEGVTDPDRMPPNRRYRHASPGLFAAQGSRLLAGRDFTWDDVFDQRRLAIVSENMARESWGEPRAGDWEADSDRTGRPVDRGHRRRGEHPCRWPPPTCSRDRLRPRWSRDRGQRFNHRTARGDVGDSKQPRRQPGVSQGSGGRRSRGQRECASGRRSHARGCLPAVHGADLVHRHAASASPRRWPWRSPSSASTECSPTLWQSGGTKSASALRSARNLARCAPSSFDKACFSRRSGAFWDSSPRRLFRAGSRRCSMTSTALDPLTYAISVAALAAGAILASVVPARRAASVDPMETLRSE